MSTTLARHPLTIYREKNRLSRSALGELLGVSHATVSRIESGDRRPSPQLVFTIEEVTGIARSRLRPDIWGKRP